MTFRIGIIGAGAHGERYARHANADVPGMRTSAICRRSVGPGSALAARFGARYHAEAEALVADPGVDGVVVCTPPSSHFDLARAVLAAGKPLLLEKPMTGTLEEARRLVELDAAAATPLLLGQSLRWNPVILKAAELWPELGSVRLIRLAQRLAPTTLAWQRRPGETVGGSVLLTGVHLFDLVRFLSGSEFVEIDSRQKQVHNPVVEDLFLARGRLDDDCWVSLEVSKFTHSRAAWLEAVGDDGQLFADYLGGGLLLRRGTDERRFDVAAGTPTLPRVLADWSTMVEEGTPPPVGVGDGLATLRVVDACYRSSTSGKSVSVAD